MEMLKTDAELGTVILFPTVLHFFGDLKEKKMEN